MSHLSVLRTQFRERETLIEVLSELGYPINLSAGQKISAGGHVRRVEFTISPPYSAPIGFQPAADGYRMIADWFLVQLERKKFTAELRRRYAYRLALKTLTEDGFALVEEKCDDSDRIHLTLRRVR